MRAQICKSVREAGFFCIMADEAKCHRQEQLAICIRYIEDLQPRERFLAFVDCSTARTAEGLFDILKLELEKLGLWKLPIVAQANDGAAVMSGVNAGLQTLIKEHHSTAVYVHCMAHKLNLVIVNAFKVNTTVQDFFDLIESLYCLFSQPHPHSLLQDLQKKMNIKLLEIVSLCDTRWACGYKSVQAVYQNFKAILEAVRILSEGTERTKVETVGLLKLVRKSDFVVSLMIMNSILPLVHACQVSLQSEGSTLSDAAGTIKSLLNELKLMRTNENSIAICEMVKFIRPDISISSNNTNKRHCPTTQFFDFVCESTFGHRDSSCASNASAHSQSLIYFEILDAMINEIERRFSPAIIELAAGVDSVLKLEHSKCGILHKYYGEAFHIDPILAVAEAKLVLQTLNSSSSGPLCLDLLRSIIKRDKQPNLFKLIQIALTLPVGLAKCERSISAMRRVKAYNRITMNKYRFSDLSLLAIESDITKSISTSQIIDIFANVKFRRLSLL